ncbi:MAG: pyruvate kinase [Clostridiales bacterium]|nr:pyruvate kinase [Clostridiales bacterium]
MRKTKIVCTLGPATDNYQTMKRLIKAGLNVARINMSHGSYAEHAARIDMVKRARAELKQAVAIMLDTKGPEIRIRTFAGGKATLADGDYFTLTTEECEGNNARVSITYADLPKFVHGGDTILLNDGLIELTVDSVAEREIVCVVTHGGELSNRKSINLPGVNIDMPYISQTDREDLLFGVSQDVDYIAASFVRCADDVRQVKTLLAENGGEKIQIIAKIENRQGVNNIKAIIDECDGAMVARGDMGVEIPFEELPAIQKQMIKLCYKQGKKVITATQMLESMITNPRPTRAEISDVANAIYDGTSAIMLSGETAVGKYCVETVKTMAKIAEKTESSIHFKNRFHTLEPEIKTITDAISHATVAASFDLNAKAIIALSNSGFTARKVSRFRPECAIIAATVSEKAYNQLAMNWGVVPVLSTLQPDYMELIAHSIECAKTTSLVKNGDLVVIAGGIPVGISSNTNTMRIEVVGDK